jgi:tRNA(adenine34) deaminase
MCAGVIVQARIASRVYGAADPRYGAVESMTRVFDMAVNHRPDIRSGVLAEESGRILKEFFLAKR